MGLFAETCHCFYLCSFKNITTFEVSRPNDSTAEFSSVLVPLISNSLCEYGRRACVELQEEITLLHTGLYCFE
jgi:hypothetical protein